MKIMMYKGKSGYDALRVFADELAEQLQKRDHEVLLLDFTKPEQVERLLFEIAEGKNRFFPDLVLSMNGIGADLRSRDGRLLHNELKVPFVSYIVDHPLYHHARLSTHLRRHHVICVNQGFAAYVKTYYPRICSVEVLMQGGLAPKEEPKQLSQRAYGVVFMGTYRNEKTIEQQICQSDPTVRDVSLCMAETLLLHPEYSLEQALEEVLQRAGITLKREAFADTMNAMHLVDKYVRALYRHLAVKALVEHGISVDVWGDHWEEILPELSEPSRLTIHAPVGYRDAAKIYQEAQIVLNVMPWVKEGLHDRLLGGMLAGAVCVSDETTTLRKEWEPDREVVLYSLAHLEQLPAIVGKLFAAPETMQTIAAAGQAHARQTHGWDFRAGELELILQKLLQTGKKE